jgi:hypothetical protein
MLTDPQADLGARQLLQQIYSQVYVEYAIKNPMATVFSRPFSIEELIAAKTESDGNNNNNNSATIGGKQDQRGAKKKGAQSSSTVKHQADLMQNEVFKHHLSLFVQQHFR